MKHLLKAALAVAAVTRRCSSRGFAFVVQVASRVGVAGSDSHRDGRPTRSRRRLPEGLMQRRRLRHAGAAGRPDGLHHRGPGGLDGLRRVLHRRSPRSSDAPSGIGISVNHDPEVTTDPCDGSVPHAGPRVERAIRRRPRRGDLSPPGPPGVRRDGHRARRLHGQAPRRPVSVELAWPTTTCSRSQRACMPTARRTAGGSGSSTSTARRPSSCCWTTRRRRPQTGPPRRRPSIRSGSRPVATAPDGRATVRPLRCRPRALIPARARPMGWQREDLCFSGHSTFAANELARVSGSR